MPSDENVRGVFRQGEWRQRVYRAVNRVKIALATATLKAKDINP